MDADGCPPDDTDNRQRSRYFAGKLPTADDLARDQDYYRAALRRHNRALHGWGIANGFDVTPTSSAEVVVQPGYALDPCGRELLLTEPVTITIAGGACIVAARAVETVGNAGAMHDDVEVVVVSNPEPPWVVLASITTDGAEVNVDGSVRRPLHLD